MMPGASDPNTRLDELESRLAFQDDAIETLNDVIARQDRTIAWLKQRIGDLETRLEDLTETAPSPNDASGHEVPPHY